MTPQYYHSNVRTWAEPQGAVDHVDDSSHLHLWLKLYFSLFPSISPLTLASWKIEVWWTWYILSHLIQSELHLHYFVEIEGMQSGQWAARSFSKLQRRSRASPDFHLCLETLCTLVLAFVSSFYFLVQITVLSSDLENSYSLVARTLAWTRALRLTPQTHANFIQTVEYISKDHLSFADWSLVSKIVRVWCISDSAVLLCAVFHLLLMMI